MIEYLLDFALESITEAIDEKISFSLLSLNSLSQPLDGVRVVLLCWEREDQFTYI